MVAVHSARPAPDQRPALLSLYAENEETTYVAYVSEQNLLSDEDGGPCRHPQIKEMFGAFGDGHYEIRDARFAN